MILYLILKYFKFDLKRNCKKIYIKIVQPKLLNIYFDLTYNLGDQCLGLRVSIE